MGLLETIAAAQVIIEFVTELPDAISKIVKEVEELIKGAPDDSPEKQQAIEQLAALKGKYSEVA